MNLKHQVLAEKIKNKIASLIVGRYAKFSWSQGCEDLIMAMFLPQGVGEYLDVGAGHPRHGSNSFLFYKRGWRGTLIEPNPQLAKKLRQERRRDETVEAVCAKNSTDLEFFLFDVWQLSTSNKQRLQALASSGLQPSSKLTVGSIKLSDLELRASPTSVTFMSVDVEGSELEVLQSNNWNLYLPRIVCVEELNYKSREESAIFSYLSLREYVITARTPFSSIFVHEAGLRSL